MISKNKFKLVSQIFHIYLEYRKCGRLNHFIKVFLSANKNRSQNNNRNSPNHNNHNNANNNRTSIVVAKLITGEIKNQYKSSWSPETGQTRSPDYIKPSNYKNYVKLDILNVDKKLRFLIDTGAEI